MSAQTLARALAYPFGIPSGSYVLDAGEPVALSDARADLDGRVPVLAFGANASPQALARKLGERARTSSVPVLAGRLRDFDVVHSAHVSVYGSIPAALQRCPGTTASVHVVHLSEEELSAVHRSEPNYVFAHLRRIDLDLEGAGRIGAVHAYLTRHGCLRLDGEPVAVAAVSAESRRWRALDQPGVLAAARDRLAPGAPLEDFVLEQAGDPEVASRRTAELRRDAEPFAWADWEEAHR